MDWGASVSRLETSIYLNFSALEELLHTYDDLFGSKHSLVIDKTLACLCNAITDILKKSSGTGREKIQRISSLKKIRSRLADVKRWETDVCLSCCQLSLISCRKITGKLSRAFWTWKNKILEEKNNEQYEVSTVDSSQLSHSRDGYSTLHHPRSPVSRLPPFPMESESVADAHLSANSDSPSLNSDRSFSHVETSSGYAPTEDSVVENAGTSPSPSISPSRSPDEDLSINVSEDSVDQRVDVLPLLSLLTDPMALYTPPSSYLASYLSSPLLQQLQCFDEGAVDQEREEPILQLHLGNQNDAIESLELDENDFFRDVSLESLSSPLRDVLPAPDTPTDPTIPHPSPVDELPPASQLSSPLVSTQIASSTIDPFQTVSPPTKRAETLSASRSSASAIEIDWNEFSSSDDASSSENGPPRHTEPKDETEGDGSSRHSDLSPDDQSSERVEAESPALSQPKDMSEYSLSAIMDYLSLPVERTPGRSVASSRSPSPALSLSERDPPQSPRQEPMQQIAPTLPSPTPRTPPPSSSSISRRSSVSSTSVLTPKQSIPPPPSALTHRRSSTNSVPRSPLQDHSRPRDSQSAGTETGRRRRDSVGIL
jgi:hypothetical protein